MLLIIIHICRYTILCIVDIHTYMVYVYITRDPIDPLPRDLYSNTLNHTKQTVSGEVTRS